MFQAPGLACACGAAEPIYDTAMAFRCLRLVLCIGPCIALAASGCGSDGDDGVAAAGGSGGSGGSAGSGSDVDASQLPYAPCSAESGVGEFLIDLGPDYTSVEGRVFDGINPSLVPTELAAAGECRLVTLPNLLCDPGCAVSTETCGTDNTCQPLPVAHDVGTVSVQGLARDVEMTPNASTGNYRPGPPALPHPGFAPGATLHLSATGGDYVPFELWGWGISAFEAPAEPIAVDAGQPVTFTWTAPADAGPARVRAQLNINNHGSSNTWVECDFPDTGSAEIPATLVDALIAQGASGFPTISLSRRTATSAQLAPGCVQLLVSSSTALDVNLAGLVSCDDDDSQCPEGQTCKPIERYCE